MWNSHATHADRVCKKLSGLFRYSQRPIRSNSNLALLNPSGFFFLFEITGLCISIRRYLVLGIHGYDIYHLKRNVTYVHH